MQFEMLVEDVFNFDDGRTVFVGFISGQSMLIRKCDCDLVADGALLRQVHIEGEMIACRKMSRLRSLSTTETIDKTKIPYKSAKVLLRCSS